MIDKSREVDKILSILDYYGLEHEKTDLSIDNYDTVKSTISKYGFELPEMLRG